MVNGLLTLGETSNLKRLEDRLSEVGLNLGIYENKPPKFIRANPRKLLSKDRLEILLKTELYETSLQNVFRCDDYRIGRSYHYRQGLFYINDLSSLIPILSLNLKRDNYLLDLCSAPGVKSSFAYDLLKGDIQLFCVDKDRKRFRGMLEYFSKYGIKSHSYNQDGIKFYPNMLFDNVLVDAPCSGEGIVTKYDNILKNQQSIEELTSVQSNLLQRGYDLLKGNGTLVYSTCALNRHENEDVVSNFLERNPSARIDLPCVSNPDVTFQKSKYIMRIIPGKTKGACFTRIIKQVSLPKPERNKERTHFPKLVHQEVHQTKQELCE